MDRHPVAGYGVGVIGNSLGNPVVAGDNFHVPDVVFVGEDHPVTFRGAVLSDEVPQVGNPFLGRLNEGQDHCHNHVFVEAGFEVEWVKGQHPFVGVDAFGCRHADVIFVKAVFVVDPLGGQIDVGYPLVAGAVGRPVADEVVEVGLNLVGVVLVSRVDHEALRGQRTVSVVVSGRHRRAINGGLFADEDGGASGEFLFHD